MGGSIRFQSRALRTHLILRRKLCAWNDGNTHAREDGKGLVGGLGTEMVGCRGRTLTVETTKSAGLEQWFALVSTGASVYYHNPRGMKQYKLILPCISNVTWVPVPRGNVLTEPGSFLETLQKTLFAGCIGRFSVFPTSTLFFPSPQARGASPENKPIVYAGSRLPREPIALQKNSESLATSTFCHL